VQTPAAPGGGRGGGGFRWSLVLDRYALTGSTAEVFAAGRQNDVPTLTGANADEGGASPQPSATLESFQRQARQRYGELADEFLALYPVRTDEEARRASNESARDQARSNLYRWAQTRAATAKTKVYTYFWTHTLPGPDAAQYGAFHTSEVPYALNTLAMSDRPFTSDDHRIADTLSSYWASFAADGDPNGPGLPRWPAVGEAGAVTMEVGDRFGPMPVAGSEAKLAFFERVAARPR
jgi:para-nitrobenzyl esterase